MLTGKDLLEFKIKNGFMAPVIEIAGDQTSFIHVLTDTFIHTVKNDLAFIKISIESENITNVRNGTHKLRSSVEIFSLENGTRLCDLLEDSEDFSRMSKILKELSSDIQYHSDLLANFLSEIYPK